MALSRIATALGGLLLSKGGRRFAGRHAGKLAMATLAFEMWQQHRNKTVSPDAASSPRPDARPHSRTRWSGRRT